VVEKDATADFLKWLSSSRETILDTLSYLGGREDLGRTPELESAVINLIDHSDDDIKEQAIFVAGIHWRIPRCLEKILNIVCLAKESDQIMFPAITSIGSMVAVNSGDLSSASRCVARIVLNESIDSELRAVAYRVLQRCHKKISMREYAASSVRDKDIHTMEWDRPWVKSLAR
jgi:hypothetical protein